MAFIDIHCHPSMMMYLTEGDLQNGNIPFSPANWVISCGKGMRTSVNKMIAGGVSAAVSVYYLPERQLIADTAAYQAMVNFLVPGVNVTLDLAGLISKFDTKKDDDNFKKLKDIIDQFQRKVDAINSQQINTTYNLKIATSFSEFESYTKVENTIVYLNSIEGANCLGTLGRTGTPVNKVIERIGILIDEYHICQFTLGHFYDNILVASSGGLPPKLATALMYSPNNFNRVYKGQGYNSDTFEPVVNYLFDRGVVIDLVHCSKIARTKIFEINSKRKSDGKKFRPLVFSHLGVLDLVKHGEDYNKYEYNKEIFPDELEIKNIHETQGVIGLVFMNYWLNGIDVKGNSVHNVGFDHILETIRYIAKTCDGSLKCIAFGSDMDGLSTVPIDLDGSDKIPGLLDKLKGQVYYSENGIDKRITDEDIQDMSFENYKRVLRLGWGDNNHT